MIHIVNDNSVTLIVDGKPHTISRGNPNFIQVRNAILDGDYQTAKSFLSIENTVKAISANLEVKKDKILYRGYEVHNVVANKIINYISEGRKNIGPLTKFLENLMQNPSSTSRSELYDFLSYKELPIDENGYVYGYKGVGNDYYSRTGNKETIVLKGRVDEVGRIFNGVGEVIQVDRGSVDDKRENNCSCGLHIGSYDYAKGWGPKVMLVRFNPKDAVSVPTDSQCQKLRVCEYEVMQEVSEKEDLNKSYVSSRAAKDFYKSNVDPIEQIKNGILDFLGDYSYEIESFEDASDLRSTMESWDAYVFSWNDSHFDIAFQEILLVAGYKQAAQFSPIEQKLIDALPKQVGKTAGQIQKNLGLTGVACRRIIEVAKSQGYKVAESKAVSKSVIK